MADIGNIFSNIPNLSDTSVEDIGSKSKIRKEWSKTPQQKYIGEVLYGNLHGQGFYLVEEGEKLFYDGLFYANKLEGYAQVFYSDGSNFQGLFKNNVRFGPGILTYTDGVQDVGFWSGQSMIRLGSLNQQNLMPRLASTNMGQLKLLKYRYLVPVCPESADIAYDIMLKLGASKSLLKRSHELYNSEVANKHNVFFNNQLFNEQFYTDQDNYIDVALTDEKEEESRGEGSQIQDPATLDIDVERIKQINEVLRDIEDKLKAVEERKLAIEKKFEYCKTCCVWDYREPEESITPPNEDKACEEVFEQREEPSTTKLPPITNKNSSFIRKPLVTTKNSTFMKKPLVTTKSSTFGKKPLEKREITPTDAESMDDLDTDLLFTEEDTTTLMSIPSEVFQEIDNEQKDADVMIQIKNYLRNSCTCDEAVSGANLYELEQELKTLTERELFFKSITDNLKEKLERHLIHAQEETKVNTKKILVNDVLSWNNEKYCMRMLKHSFLHRRSEYLVNFKVSDIIAGNRSCFQDPGLQETNCINFLMACGNGDVEAIYEHIKKHNINVNVCDAKGNSGLFFAASNYHYDVIKVLVNLGAKLDQENDEGLLPLSMCLLLYLAKKHKVEDWEKSFLPEGEHVEGDVEAFQWYPNMSLLNVPMERQDSVILKPGSKNLTSPSNVDVANPYLFGTSYPVLVEEKSENQKDTVVHMKIPFLPPADVGIKRIGNSITTLLRYGANPNAGGSPLPILFLSVFTEEPGLVESILDARVDVNVTIEEDMTSLHVIASSKCTRTNVCICHLLISYDCDPRLKTSPNHWKEQKMEILGHQINPDNIEDLGKNPLHILCMRRDFPTDTCSYFHDMVMNFVDSNIDFSDRYLGHTPLSLAVLMGNKMLVQTLINLHVIDPHQMLDHNMGNVLTIYILKRYEHLIPQNAKEILDYLSESGVNVLNSIGELDNSIAFMKKEHQSSNKKQRESKEIQKGAPKKAKAQVNHQAVLMEHIKDLGRNAIIKCIQLLAVENLYNLIEDGLARHKCVSILTEFLTPDLAICNLQLIFKHGRINPERFNSDICLRLVNIVDAHLTDMIQKEVKSKNDTGRKGSKAKPIQEVQNITLHSLDYSVVLNMTDFTRTVKDKSKFKLLPPGLDDTSKYKVCFHCLLGKDKDLLVCPRCQLIYFCSDACNKKNLKLGSSHPCNEDFYTSELARLKSPHAFLKPVNLAELYTRARENCEKRWMEKLEEEIELKRKRFEEEMKADTYGTKMLQRMKQIKLKMLRRTPTTDSLLGSIGTVSKLELWDFNAMKVSIANSNSVRWDLSSKELLQKLLTVTKTRSKINLLDKMRVEQKILGKNKPRKCFCKECATFKTLANGKCKCPCTRKKPKIKVEAKEETGIIQKKLRVIPQRCKNFVKLLTGYFPEVDFSTLLLPYACYSNGHLYYKFLNNDNYARTYSMM